MKSDLPIWSIIVVVRWSVTLSNIELDHVPKFRSTVVATYYTKPNGCATPKIAFYGKEAASNFEWRVGEPCACNLRRSP